ncbi:MAG: tRNA (adenosine(37)-N6)-threonylcarbamoyltransferase complex dimerization subunit type 1 TsaB [Tannerella sp.]|jgi:tRNA threonylcarbamoyladenosine biosynthesis protein TsaB|nr:tRNA (adenosine(37)-N6)-threonylcarbamoyltransferase complex dimerization subunit type 1 TsaB [Tannerella sp.]
MACILLIETSTTVCSVAWSVDGEVVFERVTCEGQSHAAATGVFVEEAVAYAGAEGFAPGAVAVSGGPGSYTGLRIGTSMAKGLCMGWRVPLIAVPTLDVMVAAAIRLLPAEEGLYCAMLDARRMEVYAAVYDRRGIPVRGTEAEVVTPETYRAYLDGGRVCFFGNGADKCRTVIDSPNALFLEGIYPAATDMAAPAENAFRRQAFEDVARFEPFYLKEFMATTPKNKVFARREDS